MSPPAGQWPGSWPQPAMKAMQGDEMTPAGSSYCYQSRREERQHGRAGATLAEARTCLVFSVHREEIRALDRGVAAAHRGLRARKAYGHRGVPEVRAWHGARARQRTRRLDPRRQRRPLVALHGRTGVLPGLDGRWGRQGVRPQAASQPPPLGGARSGGTGFDRANSLGRAPLAWTRASTALTRVVKSRVLNGLTI